MRERHCRPDSHVEIVVAYRSSQEGNDSRITRTTQRQCRYRPGIVIDMVAQYCFDCLFRRTIA